MDHFESETVQITTPATGPSEGYCRTAWMAVCHSQAVLEFDMSGTIASASDHFLQLVGYSLHGILGRHRRLLCFDDVTTSPDYGSFRKRLGTGRYE